jgi:hypothetical protein
MYTVDTSRQIDATCHSYTVVTRSINLARIPLARTQCVLPALSQPWPDEAHRESLQFGSHHHKQTCLTL